MIKIGRNDACPCGSGRKFKRCCLGKPAEINKGPAVRKSLQDYLKDEIDNIQLAAMAGQSVVRELGVFILWSSTNGEAWLFEVSEMDAVQLAADRQRLEISIEARPEAIEVNWSHTFAVEGKQVVLTSYGTKEREVCTQCPAPAIMAAVKRIKRKYSVEMLESVHLKEAGD